MRERLHAYLSLLLAMVLWSFSFIWYKQVFISLTPITVVFFRLLISAVLLLVITKSLGRLQLIKREDFPLFILATFFEPFLYFLGESYGVSMVTSSLAAVIIATIPLFSTVAGSWLYNEKFSTLNIIGFLISVVGVLIVMMAQDSLGNVSLLGVGSLFLAVFAAVGYSAIIKKLTGKYSPLTIVTWQNSLGILFFAPLFFGFEYNDFRKVNLTAEIIIPLLQLAVFASGFAYIFFIFGIKRVGMSRANVFANLIPVFTAVLAWHFLGEYLGILKITGIVTVVSGLFLSQLNAGTKLLHYGKRTKNK